MEPLKAMTVSLLPCPFDGEPAELQEAINDDSVETYRVLCTHCWIDSGWMGKQRAIEKWNRRVDSEHEAIVGFLNDLHTAETNGSLVINFKNGEVEVVEVIQRFDAGEPITLLSRDDETEPED